jgi:hypothetical protein
MEKEEKEENKKNEEGIKDFIKENQMSKHFHYLRKSERKCTENILRK